MKPRVLPPIVGWVPLWSEDRKTLVQIFTDLDSGSMIVTTVAQRRALWSIWEPPTEVRRDSETPTRRDCPDNGPNGL